MVLIYSGKDFVSTYIVGCVQEFSKESSVKASKKNMVSTGYTRVLNSKAREEALVGIIAEQIVLTNLDSLQFKRLELIY